MSTLQNEHFARDFFQNSLIKSPRRVFRARLPPKLTLHVCKASVLNSKNHASSLQNERFLRDFLQKSRVKIFKTSISYKASSKSQGEAPSEHTHQAALPSSLAVPAPPNSARSHVSQRHSPPPQLAISRFPAPPTKICASTPPTKCES